MGSIVYRDLHVDEAQLLGTIDRSERIDGIYRATNGILELNETRQEFPSWTGAELAGYVARLQALIDSRGRVFAAWDGSVHSAIHSTSRRLRSPTTAPSVASIFRRGRAPRAKGPQGVEAIQSRRVGGAGGRGGGRARKVVVRSATLETIAALRGTPGISRGNRPLLQVGCNETRQRHRSRLRTSHLATELPRSRHPQRGIASAHPRLHRHEPAALGP